MARILLVDDDMDICRLLERFLSRHGFDVEAAYSGKTALDMVGQKAYDLVFCDFRLKDMEGRDFIEKSRLIIPDLKIIIITGYSDVRVAVDVIKRGAIDYVIKPLIPDEILNMTKRAIGTFAVQKPVDAPASAGPQMTQRKEGNRKVSGFIKGASASAKLMHNEVKLVAPTNFSVIIYGESGAGKEHVAKSIHDLSQRKGAPFIAVDCGALTKELAGSELWGHEKGSFTGAVNAKPGQFELANGGTIFLDEISNLSYDIQVGLLRLVQERKLRRVGGVKDIEIDVRIIVASNENLKLAAQKGKFREDLYYRFNEFTVNVPSLREMQDDVMLFAEHFLQEANAELGKEISGFDDKVQDLFKRYNWPGNLRELRNVVRRAALLTDTPCIEASSLPQEIVFFDRFITSVAPEPRHPEEEKVMVESPRPEMPADLKAASAQAEAEVLRKVLEDVKYNRTKAALKLGIDRKTLFNKMKQYNL